MSSPRLFIDGELAEGTTVTGDAAQAHHLGTVLRRRVGDELRLFNARAGEFAARITAIGKGRIVMAIGPRLRPPTPEPDLRLLVAALKREALEWVIEKATELGVATIQPVFTRRTVTTRVNGERLWAIARAAAEQCERLSLPRLLPAVPLAAALEAWDGAPLLVAAERRRVPPLSRLAQAMGLPCGWLVGPEGGFETTELDAVLRHPFVSATTLGPRILRAETAAIAGLAVLQALAGDWNEQP